MHHCLVVPLTHPADPLLLTYHFPFHFTHFHVSTAQMYVNAGVCSKLRFNCLDKVVNGRTVAEAFATPIDFCAYLTDVLSITLSEAGTEADGELGIVLNVNALPTDGTSRTARIETVAVVYTDAVPNVFGGEGVPDGTSVLPSVFDVIPASTCPDPVDPDVNVGVGNLDDSTGNVLGASTASAGVAGLTFIILAAVGLVSIIGCLVYWKTAGKKDKARDDNAVEMGEAPSLASSAPMPSAALTGTTSRIVVDDNGVGAGARGGFSASSTLGSSTLASSTLASSSTATTTGDDESSQASSTSATSLSSKTSSTSSTSS